MKQLAELLRRPLIHVAAFSFVINLLLLIPALFMLQVFDRVLVSQSGETLMMLLLGAAIALGIMLALDFLRSRLQGVAGNMVGEALSPAVARVVIAARSQGGEHASSESLRDVATLRALFSAQGLIALFDAPWLLVYVAVIWIFHPVLGMAAAVSAAIMLLLAFVNDRLTRSGIEALQREAAQSSRYLEASLANAEVVQALGMAPALIDRWCDMNQKVTELQRPIAARTVAIASATRTLRQAIQIAVLALGAYLVITQEATAGIMVATTILLEGRSRRSSRSSAAGAYWRRDARRLRGCASCWTHRPVLQSAWHCPSRKAPLRRRASYTARRELIASSCKVCPCNCRRALRSGSSGLAPPANPR